MLDADLIADLVASFIEAGIESARADAEALIADVLKISRGELQAKAVVGESIDGEDLKRVRELAKRRAAREPLQHLTGKAYFRNLTLAVGPGVFVPRPETELLAGIGVDVLRALSNAEPSGERLAIDLATGSGAIALAMATEVPGTKVYAVELSQDAIAWTTKNFDAHRAEIMAAGGSLELRQGDLRDEFADLNGLADVVLSNPPYIPSDMVPIYPEVALHDPELALYGGKDGLVLVRGASKTALRLLKSGGTFAVEHADIQGPSVCALLDAHGWTNVRQHQDLNGRDRVVSAVKA